MSSLLFHIRFAVSRIAVIIFLHCITTDISAQESYQGDQDSVSTYVDSAGVGEENEYEDSEAEVRDTFILRNVPDSVIQRIKKDKDFAYANDPAFWVKYYEKPKEGFWSNFIRFMQQDAIRIMLYVILGAILLFALYRVIIVNNLFIFYSSKKAAKKQDEEFDHSDFSVDTLEEKINRHIQEKNYRMAVRYLYLKSLSLLNDKGLISYHAQATNQEYLNQLKNDPHFKDFNFLTRAYEYVWYGEFLLNDAQFETIYNSFNHFYNSLRV
jgi:hypothetical protein